MSVVASLLLGLVCNGAARAQSGIEDQLGQQVLTQYEAGKYAEGVAIAQKLLLNLERTFGPYEPAVARTLNLIGVGLYNQGRYAEAEPQYKRAMGILERVLGPDHTALAPSLNNLATLYSAQGRYADAEPLLRRALAILERVVGPDHPVVATSLNSLALVVARQKRFTDAVPLYLRALEIREKSFGPDHSGVAEVLLNFANLRVEEGSYDLAEPDLKRAQAIFEKLPGLAQVGACAALDSLATIYLAAQRNGEAALALQRSLTIAEKLLGPEHIEVARTLTRLASVYTTLGRHADAEKLLSRAFVIKEAFLGADHPEVVRTLNDLIAAYFRDGRAAAALPYVRKGLERGFALEVGAIPILFQSAKADLMPDRDAFELSFITVQRNIHASSAAAFSKLMPSFIARGGELATLLRKERELAAEADRVDMIFEIALADLVRHPNPVRQDQLRRQIDAIKAERVKHQHSFAQRAPGFVTLARPQPLSLKDTQSYLADDEMLIIFDFDVDGSYVWVIGKTSAEWRELPISAHVLDEKVRALRKAVPNFEDNAAPAPFDATLAFEVYQATFGVIFDKIVGKRRLSIVANGAFSALPPQLLIATNPAGKPLKDVDWLVRAHAVTMLPSVASLKVLRAGGPRVPAPKTLIAFADPVFSRAPPARERPAPAVTGSILRPESGDRLDLAALADSLPRLPATKTEVEEIARVLRVDRRDLYLGAAATETAVKRASLDQYRIVYFATHCLIAGDTALFARARIEPALALSFPDAPTEIDDGLLEASEVAQLKLNADWIVLSGSSTAADDRPGAEALSALARAFFYAGARSLLVTHWKPDDKAAVKLMLSTLQMHLQRPDLSFAEMLQQATLRMIDDAQTDDEASPRYWAPFAIVGEPGKRGK